jgi:nucleoid-associated protein YejK
MDTSEILRERGKRYGNFETQAEISQKLKEVLRSGNSWSDTSDDMREALDMLCNKLGRIVNGDPFHIDSWVDIAGYSTLVVEILRKAEEL